MPKETKQKSININLSARERKVIVRQIIQGYPGTGGKLAWGRAFEEHPEWRSKLGADTQRGRSSAYTMASYVMEREPEFRSLRSKKTQRKSNELGAPATSTDMVTLTGPGVNVTFSAAFLPEVLHTIAFSLSGGKKGNR